jgi:hypothetical protein
MGINSIVTSVAITALAGSFVQAEVYWPRGEDWAAATPQTAAIDEVKLAAAVKYAMGHSTQGAPSASAAAATNSPPFRR